MATEGSGETRDFLAEELLRFDAEGGVLTSRYGHRSVMVSDALVAGLEQVLRGELGETGGLVWYQAGVTMGRHNMEGFAARVRRGGGPEWSARRRAVLGDWLWPFRALGWGVWSPDFSHEGQGLTVVEVSQSAIARSVGRVGRPVCQLFSGILAGAIGVLDRAALEAVEIQCFGTGYDTCRFVAGSRAQVDRAEALRREGVPAAEILRRLTEEGAGQS